VPLHAATNYDGQLSGQKGVHGRWESELFQRFQRQIEKRIAPPRVRRIAKPSETVFEVLLASFERSRQALAASSDEASAHLLQGAWLARQGRYADAIAPIERAVALAPERWMTHYQLALALFGSGRNAEAITALERAVAINPAHPDLAARLAEARAAGG
jgi:Flp pilus assembly protein TadD